MNTGVLGDWQDCPHFTSVDTEAEGAQDSLESLVTGGRTKITHLKCVTAQRPPKSFIASHGVCLHHLPTQIPDCCSEKASAWIAKSFTPFPNQTTYMPNEGQQKVPVFGIGKENIQGGREGQVLGIGLSPRSCWPAFSPCTGCTLWFNSDVFNILTDNLPYYNGPSQILESKWLHLWEKSHLSWKSASTPRFKVGSSCAKKCSDCGFFFFFFQV